ncbi:MAG: type II toxin-antitoxin system PemK/MazF family toxin [Bryobacteraceae bacterium]
MLSGPVGPIPEVLVAYISSVLPMALMPSDLVLDPAKPEFRSTNLKTTSVLRLHKLATIHASMIARHLGNLPQSQKTTVAAELRDLLAAW